MKTQPIVRPIVEEALKEQGFKKKGPVWLRELPEVYHCVHLQRSTRGAYYFLNIGIFAKEIEPIKVPRQPYEFHLELRQSALPQASIHASKLLNEEESLPFDYRRDELRMFLSTSVESFLQLFQTLTDVETAARTPEEERLYKFHLTAPLYYHVYPEKRPKG